MSPDAEATFHRASCTLGNQVVRALDGAPFRQERHPTRIYRTPGAGSGLLTEARHSASWVIVSLDGDRILSTVESSAPRRPHRSLPHSRHGLPRANPGTRTDTHHRVRTDRVDQAGSITLRVNRACTRSASADTTTEPAS
jgi:hypothetical protein